MIFLKIRHPSPSRIPRDVRSSPLGKRCRKVLAANFPATCFHGVFPPASFLVAGSLAAYFFLGVNCLVSRISRYAFPVSLSLFGRKSFLSPCFLSRRKFSLVMHFSILLISRHIFPPNTFFFYRGFSRYTPVYFPCFLTRSLLHAFFSSSAPPSRLFSPFVFPSRMSLISLSNIFSSVFVKNHFCC